MKNLLISLIALFIISIASAQDWEILRTSLTDQDIMSVYFPDSNTGYAVSADWDNNLDGSVLKTIDGGKTWSIKYTDSADALMSVYFTSANTGFTIGYSGTILKTTDGGTTWSSQNSGTSALLSSVYFTDNNTGYISGDGCTILKTTDGRTNWSSQDSVAIGYLTSIYFPDAYTGYIVGDNSIILKTTNGGGPVNINQYNNRSVLKAYPNPTSDKLFLEIPQLSKESIISIYNTSGQLLLSQKISSPKTELDISNFQRGVYLLKYTDNKSSEVIKIVKE